jgi:hypothetical protein
MKKFVLDVAEKVTMLEEKIDKILAGRKLDQF